MTTTAVDNSKLFLFKVHLCRSFLHVVEASAFSPRRRRRCRIDKTKAHAVRRGDRNETYGGMTSKQRTECYKYLGLIQSAGLNHAKWEEHILQSNLNGIHNPSINEAQVFLIQNLWILCKQDKQKLAPNPALISWHHTLTRIKLTAKYILKL
jgi:hypothetical protein